MTSHRMELTDINGVELELWDRGSGEPVVFVHGSMAEVARWHREQCLPPVPFR